MATDRAQALRVAGIALFSGVAGAALAYAVLSRQRGAAVTSCAAVPAAREVRRCRRCWAAAPENACMPCRDGLAARARCTR
jgi:recombinational DNA repair protein RecR